VAAAYDADSASSEIKGLKVRLIRNQVNMTNPELDVKIRCDVLWETISECRSPSMPPSPVDDPIDREPSMELVSSLEPLSAPVGIPQQISEMPQPEPPVSTDAGGEAKRSYDVPPPPMPEVEVKPPATPVSDGNRIMSKPSEPSVPLEPLPAPLETLQQTPEIPQPNPELPQPEPLVRAKAKGKKGMFGRKRPRAVASLPMPKPEAKPPTTPTSATPLPEPGMQPSSNNNGESEQAQWPPGYDDYGVPSE